MYALVRCGGSGLPIIWKGKDKKYKTVENMCSTSIIYVHILMPCFGVVICWWCYQLIIIRGFQDCLITIVLLPRSQWRNPVLIYSDINWSSTATNSLTCRIGNYVFPYIICMYSKNKKKYRHHPTTTMLIVMPLITMVMAMMIMIMIIIIQRSLWWSIVIIMMITIMIYDDLLHSIIINILKFYCCYHYYSFYYRD